MKALKRLTTTLKALFGIDRDGCFSEHQRDGVCYGLHGGDKGSDGLCYTCIDCPHHEAYIYIEV